MVHLIRLKFSLWRRISVVNYSDLVRAWAYFILVYVRYVSSSLSVGLAPTDVKVAKSERLPPRHSDILCWPDAA